MLKKYSVLFFFLFNINFGLAQTKEIDSLKTILENASIHDTVKIKTSFILAGKYGPRNLDSLKKYTIEAVDLSKLNDNYLLDAAYNYLGLYYKNTGNLEKAKQYYLKAMPLVDSVKDGRKLAKILSNYAVTLNETSELKEKIAYNLRALKLRESLNQKFETGQSQFNLAVIYSNTGFDSLSVKYLKQALSNGELSNQKLFSGYVLTSLIMYALENDNLEDAKKYLKKAEEICQETGSSMLCSNTFMRKGNYLEKLEKFDEAEVAFKTALKFAEKRKVPDDIIIAYANLGKHYVKTAKPNKAIENFKKFEKYKPNNLQGKVSQLAYESWSQAERMVGNFQKSNEYLRRYVDIKDSMSLIKNKILLTNSEAKYQTEKKDKEIAQQKLALTESNSKTRTMSILIVSLLIGSILLWFSFQQRQKRMQQQLVAIEREQEVRTLESLMEGEEKERLRIAKELHDGVNGDLAAIKFKLTSLLETSNQVINEAVAMIDNSSEQVRAISHNLVPPSLRDFNLLEAVATYCENMNAIHKPEISFQHVGNDIVIDKKQEANLFRIVQELVTNSIKHAEAKEIHAQLSNVANNLQLTVEDDGKGFDSKNIRGNGIGMQNIKSRVAYLGGVLDITSDTKGTSVTITISHKQENE